MQSHVYHFTDTARLPWIVATGELRPNRNQIGGNPVDFLWATTNRQGDRTASAMMQGGYRKGVTALVRLTLHAEDFELWPAILKRFPEWTSERVRMLEAVGRRQGETSFGHWRARAETLPLSRVISVEAKAYRGNWSTIDSHAAYMRSSDPTVRGVLLNGTVFASIQDVRPGQVTSYATVKMSLAEWRRRSDQLAGL
jgi:hypothetical protein